MTRRGFLAGLLSLPILSLAAKREDTVQSKVSSPQKQDEVQLWGQIDERYNPISETYRYFARVFDDGDAVACVYGDETAEYRELCGGHYVTHAALWKCMDLLDAS